MSSIADLRYFLAAAKTGNLRRAAGAIHVSQPTLSHALRRLEERAGAVLFERGRKGVRLTRAGARFASRVAPLLAEWEALLASAGAEESAVAGTFVLGCHPSVAIYALSRFLPGLLASRPQLAVNLLHGLSREMVQAVLDGRADAALVMNPEPHAELVVRELLRDEVTLWRRRSGEWNRDTLIYDPSLAQTQWILRSLEKRKVRFSRHLESSNLEVISALVRAGAGVGIVPERVVGDALRFSSGAPGYRDRLCLVYKASFRKARLGKDVVMAMEKGLAEAARRAPSDRGRGRVP